MGLVMNVCDRHRGARLRREDRRGPPGGDPERPAGHRGLPGGAVRCCLSSSDVHVHYGKVEALKGIVAHGRRGRDRHAHRRQRRRQDHHAQDDLRRAARHQRARSRFEGEDITGMAAAQARRAGHLPGARGPRHLPRHERDGEPRDGHLRPPRASTSPRSSTACSSCSPGCSSGESQAGRHAVRRRAADARHRPGAHGQAQGAAARRAVDGPGARCSSPRSSTSSPRSTGRAPPSCWSSRTPPRRCSGPTGPTCSRWARCSCRAWPRDLHDDPSVKAAYLGGDVGAARAAAPAPAPDPDPEPPATPEPMEP